MLEMTLRSASISVAELMLPACDPRLAVDAVEHGEDRSGNGAAVYRHAREIAGAVDVRDEGIDNPLTLHDLIRACSHQAGERLRLEQCRLARQGIELDEHPWGLIVGLGRVDCAELVRDRLLETSKEVARGWRHNGVGRRRNTDDRTARRV